MSDTFLGLAGKVAVVSGASKGIGAAVTTALLRQGVKVLALSRTRLPDSVSGPALAVGASAGADLVWLGVDLMADGACERALATAMEAYGRVDILSNNAGSTRPGDFFALSDQAWEQGFGLKFHGARRLSKTCWPALKASGGCIVNTIGIMSRTAVIDYAMGGAVNSALLHLTKALAHQGARDGVRVNAVNPGHIATDRLDTAINALMEEKSIGRAQAESLLLAKSGITRFGTTEEVAATICFLASPAASFVNGSILEVDGGETRGT
ncbi:MAG: SDR family oxidoreductase [Pseudomonadota bacterium]